MANIPVERTSTGTPWWLWLVGLLLLGGLIWLLASVFGDDDDEVIVENTPEQATVAGDFLDLSDVYVTRVVGDNTFFVAPTQGGADETLVYLGDAPDSADGRYDVTVGQHLSIDGSLEAPPADMTPWGLTAAQAATVGDQYVRATRLTVLDGPMAADGRAMDDDAADGAAGTASDPDGDLAALSGDLSAVAGRPVKLDNVRVTALAGDSTFYVGSGALRTLVVLESLGEREGGDGTGEDGVFNVNVGDRVDIRGEIKSFSRTMRGASTLAEADLAAATARRFVVVVNDQGDLKKR